MALAHFAFSYFSGKFLPFSPLAGLN
jgi:hypothetical protein